MKEKLLRIINTYYVNPCRIIDFKESIDYERINLIKFVSDFFKVVYNSKYNIQVGVKIRDKNQYITLVDDKYKKHELNITDAAYEMSINEAEGYDEYKIQKFLNDFDGIRYYMIFNIHKDSVITESLVNTIIEGGYDIEKFIKKFNGYKPVYGIIDRANDIIPGKFGFRLFETREERDKEARKIKNVDSDYYVFTNKIKVREI